ncbi:MAG: helix-turn-helix transcriptional regulator [Bdellovibrionales bacterium]|nr:helix-turn-helix transcriptional regulator [Bdellovibrionales bacterium]
MLNVTAGEKDFLFSEEGMSYLKTHLSEQGLSRRETEVVVLVLQGLTNRQVADKLCVAEKTVKFHLTNIYKRMKISRRSQIVWTLPLGDFVEKFKYNTSTASNKTAEPASSSIDSSCEEDEVEISIPTGRRVVSDVTD